MSRRVHAGRWVAVLGAVAACISACARPVATARSTPHAPPSARELEAAERVRERRCSVMWSLAFPGLGHYCLRQDGEAAVLGGLALAEIGATTAIVLTHEDDPLVLGDEDPPVTAPLTALQDLWVVGVFDALLEDDLARRRLFTPQDTLSELALAPFNHEVMKRPAVWLGLLGTLALGVGASFIIDAPDTSELGDDPRLFGHEVDAGWGYAAGGALGVGLFSHVAIAEEVLFRGWLQSAMSRQHGETFGWVSASLAFGAIHLANLTVIPEEDHRDYLVYAMPVITTAGFYLGWLYQNEGYTLAPPVAVHFWYDTLLSAIYFALDPDDNIFSARLSLPL